MSQTTSATPKRAGTPKPGPSLYDTDRCAWSLEQARLLRERRFDEVDVENVAEEILDLSKTEYRVLESALRLLLTHMLKWDHQSERRSRSWESTIAIQRRHALEQLAENPSLKTRRDEAIAKAYHDARLEASGETDIDLSRFPRDLPLFLGRGRGTGPHACSW